MTSQILMRRYGWKRSCAIASFCSLSGIWGLFLTRISLYHCTGGRGGEGKGRIRNASLSNFRVCRSEVKTAVITNGERASDSPQVLALLTSLEPQRTKLASESNAGIHHLGRGRESIVQTAGPSFFHCTVNGLFQPSVLTAFNF